MVANSSGHWVRGGVHPGQIASCESNENTYLIYKDPHKALPLEKKTNNW